MTILFTNRHIMDIKIGYSFFTYIQIYRTANDKQITTEATVSFNSIYFSLASIQLVFSPFCLHFHASVSFKHRFHSHTRLLVTQKLSSAMFSLWMYSINNFKYAVQCPRSIRSNSAGCACKISALISFIIPYALVSNKVNIDVRFFIGVLRFVITGNLELTDAAILALRLVG